MKPIHIGESVSEQLSHVFEMLPYINYIVNTKPHDTVIIVNIVNIFNLVIVVNIVDTLKVIDIVNIFSKFDNIVNIVDKINVV